MPKHYKKTKNMTLRKISHSQESFDGGLPKVTFSEKDLPEIKNWKVGGKYVLNIEVEMVAEKQGSEYEFEQSDNLLKGVFKIHSVGAKEDDMHEEDFNEQYSRMRSGSPRRV